MSVTLSTHVLDTGVGRPASGVPVRLERDGIAVGTGTSDRDGRIASFGANLQAGTHRLVFDLGTYFREKGVPGIFFTRVAVDIDLAEGHQHVPLLMSRYGLSSYRGS